jgi:hypothetical protein
LPLETDKFEPESIFISDVFDKWIEDTEVNERETFVNGFFNALAADGSITINDIVKKGPMGFENILIKFLGSNKTTLRLAFGLPRTAILGNTISKDPLAAIIDKIDSSFLIQIILLFLSGFLCIILPNSFLKIIVASVFFFFIAFELIITVQRLIKCKFDLHKEQTRVNLCIIMIAIYVVLFVKHEALFLASSIFWGVAFLIWGYHAMSQIKNDNSNRWKKIRHIFETFVFLMDGMYILIAPEQTLNWYVVTLGEIFILDAILRTISRILENNSTH